MENEKKNTASSGLLDFDGPGTDPFAFHNKPLPPEPTASNLIEDFLKAEAGDFGFGTPGESSVLGSNKDDFGLYDSKKPDEFGISKADDFGKFESNDDYGSFDSPKKSASDFSSKGGAKDMFEDFMDDVKTGGVGGSPPLTPRPDYDFIGKETSSAREPSPLPREPSPLAREPSPLAREPSPLPREPSPLPSTPTPPREPTPSPPREPTPSPPREPTPPLIAPPKEPTPPPKEPTPPPKEPTPPPKEPTPPPKEPTPPPKEPTPPPVVREVKPAPVRERPASVSDIAPKDLFANIGLDAWFNPGRLHPKVESLVYWRDVKKSGVVFGVTLACLLSLVYCSLISVVSYLCLLSLSGSVSFRIYKNVMQAVQKTSDGHPFKDLLEVDIEIKEDKAKEVTSAVVSRVNSWLTELRRLFLVVDLIDSLKFGVCLWGLTYVGALFNGLSLIILCWIALFTLPKVYENNKQQVDAFLELANSKISEITNKVKAALPGKKEEKKDQ